MADSLELELEIKGVEQVTKMLTNVGADMKDLKGAMADVGEHAKKFSAARCSHHAGEYSDNHGRALVPPTPRRRRSVTPAGHHS